MRAVILSIGDEIVAGLTVDTNSGYIADRLRTVGVETVGFAAVPDDEASILRALERACEDAEVVISTGGLGPTADDLTTATVARFAGLPLVLDQPSLDAIAARFRDSRREMPPNNRKQALLPRGCAIVANRSGTAPGFICAVERNVRTCHIVSLPGVPREMRAMLEESVNPWLAERSVARRFTARVFSTFGLSESRLDELLEGLVRPEDARISFRAAFPRIQTRVTVSGGPGDDLEERLDAIEARIRERIGTYIYAVGDEGLESAVVELLSARGLTLAVAESCTGGLIGHRITEVPGSSACFLLDVVAYANESKYVILGVREETIAEHGAVSTQTAEEMAVGVRRIGGADLGLATTGIAGPGGGTPEKPVGTVCIALAWEGGVRSERIDLGPRSRDWIKSWTAQLALDRLRKRVLGFAEADGIRG
jgi:nicotinamide-nucleotide amidase